MEYRQVDSYSEKQGQSVSALIRKVYGWMSIALLITGATAALVANNHNVINYLMTNSWAFWGLFILQLGMVIFLSARVEKMSVTTASTVFILYSFITGVTFSMLFMIYTTESIASTFFITASVFAVMSIFGFMTKKDLTSVGSLSFMALIGIIIASVVNIFLHSTTLYWIITYVGVLIFVGLIAYDTQKLKTLALVQGEEMKSKLAILGALTLYLDFINLFLMLLRIFGRRNN
ncbi:MAG: Bax inhibitor-1/YccA family protein [Bacteroidales bacterium]